jgi:beta-aspartyl-peptidase (threonine type)
MTSRVPALIVHGGAGADPQEGREELREGIRQAVQAGWDALEAGGSSLDAVEAAVRVLEDHPRFNAGRGSVLTSAGTVEMDASIMEGNELRNGAVGSVTAIRHPISLARRILESGRHALFVGAGAVERARAFGIPPCDPAELITERQQKRLRAVQAGTVGAVAMDRRGVIAAATSTGGMAGKLPGRVGDSALIGCGTYAESNLGGVSCTGDGEAIIRVVLARRALETLKSVDDPGQACRVAVDVLVEEGRGQGGLILVDWKGRMGWAHSTPLMPVGVMSPSHAAPVIPF